jgi:uncharacterized protein (DUF4415 family)
VETADVLLARERRVKMREKGITRVSSKDLHKIKDLTDWKRVDAMTEEDIERAAASDPDAPMTTAADWVNAKIVWPQGKEPVTIRIDKDVLNWFRKHGRGYQSRMNAVLRSFVEAHKHTRSRRTASARK